MGKLGVRGSVCVGGRGGGRRGGVCIIMLGESGLHVPLRSLRGVSASSTGLHMLLLAYYCNTRRLCRLIRDMQRVSELCHYQLTAHK